jgi:hypothetical protein
MAQWTWFRLASTGISGPTFSKNIWDGSWLGGTGADAGLRERTFALWCRRRGHLCVRTVDLLWFLLHHPGGFLKFDMRALKQVWRYQAQKPRLLLKFGVWELSNRGERKLRGRELRDWVKRWHPHPGRWDLYLERKRRYYAKNLARFEAVSRFWKRCPLRAKRSFLRCRRYSNRAPEAHPDYFVVFKPQEHAFVEVKGDGESFRPRQRRFFLELVRNASQLILLVRIEPARKRLRWFWVEPSGIRLLPAYRPGITPESKTRPQSVG